MLQFIDEKHSSQGKKYSLLGARNRLWYIYCSWNMSWHGLFMLFAVQEQLERLPPWAGKVFLALGPVNQPPARCITAIMSMSQCYRYLYDHSLRPVDDRLRACSQHVPPFLQSDKGKGSFVMVGCFSQDSGSDSASAEAMVSIAAIIATIKLLFVTGCPTLLRLSSAIFDNLILALGR